MKSIKLKPRIGRIVNQSAKIESITALMPDQNRVFLQAR